MSGAGRNWILYGVPLGLIVVAGAALRIAHIDQSLVADELWSYTEATRFDFGGMIDYVEGVQEVTPPLFTIIVWLAAQVSEAAAVVRIPSVAAGILTIPLVFLIGDRTIGRRPALLAALLAALSPILIWYSVELRAYSLAVLLSSGSTLCLLLAVERSRLIWWGAYAVLVAASMYTHYTVVYVLATQLLWVLVFRPPARKPVLIATAAAAVLYLPWLPGLRADLDAPAQHIISALSPFSLHEFADTTVRAVLGPPLVSIREFYLGIGVLVLFAIGVAVALAGTITTARAGFGLRGTARDLALPAMLAVAAPAGAAFVSLVAEDQFLVRNLLTSVPGIILVIAALVCSGPLLTRVISGVLIVGTFAIGSVRTLEPRFQRVDYNAAAAYIDATAGPADVVLDISGTVGGVGGAALTPAAYTLDVALEQPHRIVDAVDLQAGKAALRQARGGRLFLVGTPVFVALGREGLGLDAAPDEQRIYPGELPLVVAVYDIPERGSAGP